MREVWREKLTLGKTRTQETRNLLDEGIGSQESIVLASKLLDELLVLVQLLQVIGRHGINAVVLGTVKIVLVTENTVPYQSSFLFSFFESKVRIDIWVV